MTPDDSVTRFGERAQFVPCAPLEIPTLAADTSALADAIREALVRKSNGHPFAVRLIAPTQRSSILTAVAGNVLETNDSYDARRAVFDAASAGTMTVNATPIGDLRVYTSEQRRLMRALIGIAETLVVASETERRRLSDLVGRQLTARVAMGGSSVSSTADAGQRDAVFVWAPRCSASDAYARIISLRPRHAPIVVACKAAQPPIDGVMFVAADESSSSRARAQTIVVLDDIDPSDAVALSADGVPLVADVESGAHERLAGIRTFDITQPGSLLEAVSSAVDTPTKLDAPTNCAPAPSVRPASPLVSILISTYNRPDQLREALESIRRQRYPNVETIVVNDAGVPVVDVVSSFENARYIEMKTNDATRAFNTAYGASRGTYIGLLGDDDVYFPDHVERLVGALERTGASVAYGDVLSGFVRGSGTQWEIYGIDCLMTHTVDLDTLLVTNQLGGNSTIMRRDLFERDGWIIDESIRYCRDFSLWLRLATRVDFVHVPYLTSIYAVSNQGAQQISTTMENRLLPAFETIYRSHPVAGRPILEARRQVRLDEIGRDASTLQTTPAATFLPLPWPLWNRRALTPP